MNDLKCSIIQVLTYLYLRVPCPFMIQTHLFKIINKNKNQEMSNLNKLELNKIIYYIHDIQNNKEEKLDIKGINQYCLLQFFELIKYTLRNIYLIKNNINESDRDNIYNLIINVKNLLENYLGLSKKTGIQEEKILNSFNSIKDEKLNIKNPMFVISENYQYLFLKYKNKLKEAINKQNEKGNNTKIFLSILSDICDKDRIQKNKYDKGMAEITKKNIKLLRKFDLKGVLMDVSLNSNKNTEDLGNLILLIMEEIILEFIKYLEYATIEEIGDEIDNIFKKKQVEVNIKTN